MAEKYQQFEVESIDGKHLLRVRRIRDGKCGTVEITASDLGQCRNLVGHVLSIVLDTGKCVADQYPCLDNRDLPKTTSGNWRF
jgi:hypothetical protein